MVLGCQSRAASTKSPAAGQALRWNGMLNEWEPGTPDTTLGGRRQRPGVVKALQGRAVSTAVPADGQVLTWNGAASQWEPRNGGGGSSGSSGAPPGFTVRRDSATELTIGEESFALDAVLT